MGVYIKGSPSEGIYKLTYQDTSDKGMVAVLEGEDIAFIGQIVKAPHGRLKDESVIVVNLMEYSKGNKTIGQCFDEVPTVIEAEE